MPATGASAVITAVYSLFFSTLCTGRNAASDNSGAWNRITGAISSLAASVTTIKTPDTLCETGEGIDCCTGRVSFNASVYFASLTAATFLTYITVRKFFPISVAPIAATSPTATSPAHSRTQSAPATVSADGRDALLQQLRLRAQSAPQTVFVPGDENSQDA
jgi:hypothetical protein